jgi:hypothetical protein
MSHIKTLKITPTCFDHQMIIIGELFVSWLKSLVKIGVFRCGYAAAYVHSFCILYIVRRGMSTCLSTQYTICKTNERMLPHNNT